MPMTDQHIPKEIRRTAEANGGSPHDSGRFDG